MISHSVSACSLFHVTHILISTGSKKYQTLQVRILWFRSSPKGCSECINCFRPKETTSLDSGFDSREIDVTVFPIDVTFRQIGNIVVSVTAVDAQQDHPQLRRMPMGTPAGEIQVVAPPVKVVDGDAPTVLPVPALGAHSEAIAREFS